MTPPILPDHAPGIGWAIADLLNRARIAELRAEQSIVRSSRIDELFRHAQELRYIADEWRAQLEDGQ